MRYKNFEIFNVAEIFPSATGEGMTWRRIPKSVEDKLESGAQGFAMARNSTGVEFRFVLHGDQAVLRLAKENKNDLTNIFHVYYGSIQGGWEDCEVNKCVGEDYADYVIKKPSNVPLLRKMAADSKDPFSPDVIRVIFDRGNYRFLDILGDISAPTEDMLPKESVLFYGSSITHGSNSIDLSHSFASVIGHNLKADVINKGFAGACWLEKDFIDYLSTLADDEKVKLVVLELGINVLFFDEEKIKERVQYAIDEIAAKHPDKKVCLISPFYSDNDYCNAGKEANKWRTIMQKLVTGSGLSNLSYINGLDIIGDMSYICADYVHPNIYGISKIAADLTAVFKELLGK